MIRVAREVKSQTEYILGTDRRLFWNVSVRDSRNNSVNYMVLGCLCSAPRRGHSRYLGGRKQPPLRPPTALTREDGVFAALRRTIPKPHARDARKKLGSWRPHGDLLTGESLRDEIPQRISPSFGGWAVRLRQA